MGHIMPFNCFSCSEPHHRDAVATLHHLLSIDVDCAGQSLVRHVSGPVAAPCLPTSLLQPLMKLAQSFVLANPEEPDCPIVYASQRFLDLTGYPRYCICLAGVRNSSILTPILCLPCGVIG